MDINSLLSPQGGSTPKVSPPLPSPPKARRANTGSSQVITPSPLMQSTLPPPGVPAHALASRMSNALTSPSRSPQVAALSDAAAGEAASTKVSSTPSMDALADLASMQNHQPSRSAAPLLRRSTESFESQRSPSTMYPTVQTVTTIAPRSSIDFAMGDPSKENIRTDFSQTSLSRDRQARAATLVSYLLENPYALEAHVELISLLHGAFMEHVYPPDTPDAQGDPHAFDLITDLRFARETMSKYFAIGEALWVDWIRDESMLTTTIEERISVMENCSKAVEEEYGSTKLWTIYGDWVLYTHDLVQEESSSDHKSDLSEEDRMVGREIFTWQLVLEVWAKAAEETWWHIKDSHTVWNRHIELLTRDLSRNPSEEKVSHIKSLFDTRLKVPQSGWDDTFQLFSNFVTRHMNNSYEKIMKSTIAATKEAKAILSSREELEFDLGKTIEIGDKSTEYALWTRYIEREATPKRKYQHTFELRNALYERAELRFPSDHNLWHDHFDLLLEAKKSTLSLLSRATRHCPWSGSLWSQYVLTSDREGLSYPETEEIKHKATNSGLLDVGGMEEVIKVHTAWCNYLRRRAFAVGASDEDLDVAEMGIRSSIETIQENGVKKHGPSYKGDPYFRLERVYIKFLTESGSWDNARETFRGLIDRCGSSWEFWLRWYVWEMMCWAKFIRTEHAPLDEPRKATAPHYATAVLEQSMAQANVDWPERLIASYTNHCEDHEDAETLQSAMARVRVVEKDLTRRRQKEAESAEAASENVADHPASYTENSTHVGKRKREDEAQTVDEVSKKSRPEIEDATMTETPSSVPKEKQLKRDRENSTILVGNLPEDIADTRVRQFFRDCGTINTLKVLRDTPNEPTAIVEFDEHEAALAAQTRDGKDLDGHTVSVQLGSGSTLFVSNFPPTADEPYLRELFDGYGEIVDIRFPSLKYNTHRRFCYVQYKLNMEAQAATELDGHIVGEGLKLVAKVSNPLNKQDRSGALEEGREIYVRNIDWSTSEDELSNLFKKYGSVQSSRIPRDVSGRSKGFGYIVFSTKDEATAALEMNEQQIKSRRLHVEISSKTGAKRQATSIINRVGKARSPSVGQNGDRSAESPSADSPKSTGQANTGGYRFARTIALLNVPDTVNDARIRLIAEPYGDLVKISLRPDHQGAILEYLDVSSAGKASLGLEGFEITPERKLRVGTVPEMLRQTADRKVDKIQVGKQKKQESGKPAAIALGGLPISRPSQPSSGRRGRGGGLGFKRGGGRPPASTLTGADKGTNGTSSAPDKKNPNGEGAEAAAGTKKTNDYFSAMLGSR